MDKKLKLTAEQVKMVQQYKDKKIKISETQYKRLSEYIDSEVTNLSEGQFPEYRETPNISKPAAQLNRRFKKYGKAVPGFKAENEKLTGHPIGGDGGEEYNPQTPEENGKTFDSLNESFTIDLIQFTQELLQTLKQILTDPSQAGLSTVWVKMGVSRGELFGLLSDFAIIGYSGHKLVVITKNLAKKVKRLYYALSDKKLEQSEEKQQKESMGDDIEVSEDNYPVGADNDSNAPWNQKEPNYSEPLTGDSDLYDIVFINKDISIFKGKRDGGLYFFPYSHMDKNEFREFAYVPYETQSDEEGGDGTYDEYGDFEIDGDVLDRYVNYQGNNLKVGTTFDDYEDGIFGLIKINNEIAFDILKTWGNNKILRNLFKVSRKENVSKKGKIVNEVKMTPNFTKLKDKTGKIRKLTKNDGDYKASEGEKKCGTCKYFGKNICKVIRGTIDKEMLCNYYDKKNETSETTVAGGAGDGGSSGPFVTPNVWAKDKKNWGNGTKPLYPSGQIVQQENVSIKFSKGQFKLLKENFDKTQWPEGEFVEFDDCVKFNNNKTAQNGGCSTGAVDGVVKTKKGKGSVSSKEALYYERVANKTGKSFDEVKTIIESNLTEAGVKDLLSRINPKNYKYNKPNGDKQPEVENPEIEKPEIEKPEIEKPESNGSEIEQMQKQAIEAYVDDRDKKAQVIMKPFFDKFIGKKFSYGNIKDIFITPYDGSKPVYQINIMLDSVNVRYYYYVMSDKLEGVIIAGHGKNFDIFDDRQDGQSRVIVPNSGAGKLLSNFILQLNPNSAYTSESNNFVLLGDSTGSDNIWEKGINAANKKSDKSGTY